MQADHTNALSHHVVILGAGQAGGFLAANLRQAGYAGRITLYGDERKPPYNRPPLSKDYLKAGIDNLDLRPDGFYIEFDVSIKLGMRATRIDVASHQVFFADGSAASYDTLVIATGVRPRLLEVEGGDLDGIHQLRTLDDALALRSAIRPGSRIGLIGGGYIGLEVAASAVALGARPFVLERQSRLLARVASEPVSYFLSERHRLRGVEVMTDAALKRFVSDGNGNVAAVELADGSRLDCDAALLCVGAHPNDEIAQAAGIRCENGIVVDQAGRTSVPGIFAIGDVTRRPLAMYGQQLHRVESVQNAMEQARQVAAAITAGPPPSPEIPWFWSDQFDVKLQIAGLAIDADNVVIRGDMTGAKFSVMHFKANRLVCLEAVNSPGDFIAGKQLIARARPIDQAMAANTAVPLKQLATG